MRRSFVATAAAAAALALVAGGCARRGASARAAPATPVPRAPAAASSSLALASAQPAVAPESASESESAAPGAGCVGIVVAPASADLASQLESRVVRVRVRPGDVVQAGAVLAELDTNAARKELAIAEAELLSARADLRRAELDARDASERAERRAGTIELPSGGTVGAVSGEELSSARYQAALGGVKIEAARAGVAQKRARRDELAMLADEGGVRAPFGGVVAERFVDAGAMLHKGQPIVRLIGGSAPRVRFAMRETDARRVDVGAAVRVSTDGLTLGATVEKVAPEVDAAARLVFAEATLDVPPDERDHVRSGSAARVFLPASVTR
jgi:multidrug efflux pump subunit AcrA (membrane-fusion protein)